MLLERREYLIGLCGNADIRLHSRKRAEIAALTWAIETILKVYPDLDGTAPLPGKERQ